MKEMSKGTKMNMGDAMKCFMYYSVEEILVVKKNVNMVWCLHLYSTFSSSLGHTGKKKK